MRMRIYLCPRSPPRTTASPPTSRRAAKEKIIQAKIAMAGLLDVFAYISNEKNIGRSPRQAKPSDLVAGSRCGAAIEVALGFREGVLADLRACDAAVEVIRADVDAAVE